MSPPYRLFFMDIIFKAYINSKEHFSGKLMIMTHQLQHMRYERFRQNDNGWMI